MKKAHAVKTEGNEKSGSRKMQSNGKAAAIKTEGNEKAAAAKCNEAEMKSGQ